MKRALIAGLALLATACTSVPPVQIHVDAPDVAAPASVTRVCEPLPRMGQSGPEATMGELRLYTGLVVGAYGVCGERDRAKADWIRSQETARREAAQKNPR